MRADQIAPGATLVLGAERNRRDGDRCHGRAASTSLARLDTVAHSAVSVQIQASKSIIP